MYAADDLKTSTQNILFMKIIVKVRMISAADGSKVSACEKRLKSDFITLSFSIDLQQRRKMSTLSGNLLRM